MTTASNVSAMVTNTVNILRDNLHDRYDSGFPVLKELIQNANDAGASELFISQNAGIRTAQHDLLQKPALLVYNDGKVTDKDLEGIISVAQGGKTGKAGVIGKFGLGMKSIFHFCDLFFYVAFQNGNRRIQLVNPFIDPRTGEDPYHKNWNILSESDSKTLEEEVLKISGTRKDGLMLWIPLRDESYKYKILSDIYKIENIWKQNSDELRKNVALALAALEISTPCNKGQRSLEKIRIQTQTPSIELEYKTGTKVITSDGKEYCSVIKSNPLEDTEGKRLLKELIETDKFTKISYVDEEGNDHEIATYDENQFVSMAIVKFLNSFEHTLNFKWCSYLPLNSKADTRDYFDILDSEYHFLIHANFAIDSGRRNVVDFNECIDKNSDLNIPNLVDDRAAQGAWNKVLIRDFILPRILQFACESGMSDIFMHCLYSVLCDFSGLGYYCLDKGFAFLDGAKWIFHNAENIQNTALQLIQLMNQYQTEHEHLHEEQVYKTFIKVCDYIQNHYEGINWAIVNTKKAITDTDIGYISKIIADNKYPLLYLPVNYTGIKTASYKFTDVSIVIAFLLCFEKDQLKELEYLSNKVGFLFEYLCEDDCLDKELCSQIYTDINIRQFIPLFELAQVNKTSTRYLSVYKTYNEVKRIAEDNRLFSNYGVDNKNTYLHKYAKIFSNIELYIITESVAKKQFFLKDCGPEAIYRFDDINNPVGVLNCLNLESVLLSMKSHLSLITYNDIQATTDFIRDVQTLPDESLDSYRDTVRAIISGREIEPVKKLFLFSDKAERLEKALFYKDILGKISIIYSENAFINPKIEVSRLLYEYLHIEEIDCAWFERRFEDEYTAIKSLSNEEKDKLAESIESSQIFKRLPVHKTLSGEYVSLENMNDIYLENEIYRFPDGYIVPEKVKIIALTHKSNLQKDSIKSLQPENIVNIMLLDEDSELGTPNGIRYANYLKELLNETNIKPDLILPNSRKKRWIPHLRSYYSLDEVISNPHVNSKLISLCDNLILNKDIDIEYRCLDSYFVRDDAKALEVLITHANKASDEAWPWFNLNDYPSVLHENNKVAAFNLISKSKDPLFTVVSEFKTAEESIDYIKQIPEELFVKDKFILDAYKINYLINLCSDEIEGQKVEDYKKNHLEEIISSMDSESVKRFVEAANEKVCLPSKAYKWQSIDKLVNFDTAISDLSDENALCDCLHKYFPGNSEREGEKNSNQIPIKEFIEKIAGCKCKKLWGAFSYIISTSEGQRLVWENRDLFEQETKTEFEKMRLPKLDSSTIIVHDTIGNYCLSLTGKKVNLKDAADVDSVFYKNPTFDGTALIVDLFDNFIKFSSTSIEVAIKELLDLFGIHEVSDNFFKNLANPDQLKLEIAVNIIFNNIFNTLKLLKVDYSQSKYKIIADNREKYLIACGESNFEVIQSCCNNIKNYIEQNETYMGRPIQEEIREKVKTFIGNEEYKERCILFELFQNADDAYNQLKKFSGNPDFIVSFKDNSLIIEHRGRPINQYMVGSAEPAYREDLTNMLTIGCSDKSIIKNGGRQTGKFGYGFKTVYLICDEPHIISGDYNFIIKAALYPKSVSQESNYTDTTSIILKLNDNGLRCKDDIISEFQIASQYQVLFSKKIRHISCCGQSYKWEPNPELNPILKDFDVEINQNFIVFRTKPIFDEQVCIAFRKSGDQVIAFDEEAPKVWCMAPLLDLPNIGFAISANFKTNTGRQTLAQQDPSNINLISKIAVMFAEALEELWNMDDYKKLIPSLVNVTLIGTTKSVLEPIPKKLIHKFLGLGYVPDGISKFYKYSGQELYSLSASYFNDKFKTQFDTIDEANLFISDNSHLSMQVITQIAADELKDLGIDSKNPNKLIFILDKILDSESELESQKEILMNFSHTSLLYDTVQKEREKLSNCKLYDEEGLLKPIGQIYNLSEDYGHSKSVAEVLFTPSREAHKKHEEDFKAAMAASQPGLDFGIPEPEPENHITFSDVYNEWKASVIKNEWIETVEKYYNSKLYPEFLSFNELSEDLIIGNASDGELPEKWTVLLLLAITQSLTAWGHTDVTNREAIKWLYSNDLIQKFSSGMELQELYDYYLEVSETDEKYLRHFECMLRIYKIRKDFAKFYGLLTQLPRKENLDDITHFLVTSSDPELSGMGIKLSSSKKSLRLGISLLIRDLLRCGFWKQLGFEEDDIASLYKFAYMPKKVVINSMIDLNDNAESKQIYAEILSQLPDDEYKEQFIKSFDLPFIIYGKSWS